MSPVCSCVFIAGLMYPRLIGALLQGVEPLIPQCQFTAVSHPFLCRWRSRYMPMFTFSFEANLLLLLYIKENLSCYCVCIIYVFFLCTMLHILFIFTCTVCLVLFLCVFVCVGEWGGGAVDESGRCRDCGVAPGPTTGHKRSVQRLIIRAK